MDYLIKLLILPSVIGLSFGVIATSTSDTSTLSEPLHALRSYRTQTILGEPTKSTITAAPTLTPSPSLTPVPTKASAIQKLKASLPTDAPQAQPTAQWGVAQKIGEDTYTIKVQDDASMASPNEVYLALNQYRQTHGTHTLSWDDKLASYAQGRADTFKSIQNVDGHAGFNSYLENEGGFEKLGFMSLGENSYYGGPLTGTHVIEWVFAQSPGHNANQLDGGWTHVGIGVTGNSINLNFGGQKM